MRITHVHGSLTAPLGGAESYLLAIATAQAARGHDVDIRCGAADERTVARAKSAGVTIRVGRVWRPYRPDEHGGSFFARLLFHGLDVVQAVWSVRAVRDVQRGADVVHVHRFQGMGAGVLRARHCAVVHTAHDYGLVDTQSTSVRDGVWPRRMGICQRLRARAVWIAARAATVIIFPSARTLDRHRSLGLPSGGPRQIVVPHGWPRPGSVGEASARVRGRFLYLGRLERSKGIDVLLAAWVAAGVDGELVVAGDGPERDAVETASDDSVTVAGWVDGERKAALIASATAVVFPSQWPETFGLVMAESLLMGTPVVATPAAAGSLVVDGVNGLVAERSDSSALAAALRRLAEDEGLARRLAEGARRSSEQLDFDRHLDGLQEVYADARATFTAGIAGRHTHPGAGGTRRPRG